MKVYNNTNNTEIILFKIDLDAFLNVDLPNEYNLDNVNYELLFEYNVQMQQYKTARIYIDKELEYFVVNYLKIKNYTILHDKEEYNCLYFIYKCIGLIENDFKIHELYKSSSDIGQNILYIY